MKKQIDVIVKYFYPVAAGIETNILETYSVLAKNGWDITIHTSKDTLTEKNTLSSLETIKGLRVKRYNYRRPYGFWPKIDWGKTNMVALHNFDIVPHFVVLAYSLLRKFIGQKNYALVLTPHGGFTPEWSVFPKIRGIIKKYYHFTLGTFLINACVDTVRAVSSWEANEIESNGVAKNKIITIPNGVEDEAYKNVDKLASEDVINQVKAFGKYIIQVGRVYPIKNYETVVRALVNLPEDVKYVIVGPLDYVMGKATYKEYLVSLSNELGVSDRVIFAGVLRGVDKYYIMKHAQMMVHMAIWESFCNVVHEGLSQGLVCIVANNTALPYIVKDNVNGFCVETRDVKSVSEKINYVLKNKESKEIKEMENRNKIYGLENSWRSIAEKVEALYSTLCQDENSKNGSGLNVIEVRA